MNSKTENANTNHANRERQRQREDANRAQDRREAEKNARFGGCRV